MGTDPGVLQGPSKRRQKTGGLTGVSRNKALRLSRGKAMQGFTPSSPKKSGQTPTSDALGNIKHYNRALTKRHEVPWRIYATGIYKIIPRGALPKSHACPDNHGAKRIFLAKICGFTGLFYFPKV
jgi:hypothetical protein